MDLLEYFDLFVRSVAAAYLIVMGGSTVWFVWMTTCRPEQWLKICQTERDRRREEEVEL